ncbi:MAG: thiamine phosphate synthase [Muribaculaceae bacterium]|nr:thiamine phosphate synthase [Muribaculaceae bacterium]MDE7343269.1 thiamine phosphate synthase [Muribaculaceae bacterium]
MLQYITNTDSPHSIPEQVKAVLEGGCRWVQLRMKDASADEVAEMARTIKPLTDEKEAFLIINDHVDVCRDVNCTGVHLGKSDMPPSKARLELGPLAVIGVTANTFEDIEAVQALDIDYIGMGPYADTNTKKNLAPILGISGIADLCNQMKSAEINIAHVAVGGIRLEDVQPLLEAGCDGIAVSGAIAFADDMVEATRKFIAMLPAGV